MNFLDAALKSENPSHIQSIQKAVIIFELLASEDGAMSITEISNKLGWPKSTVHSIVSTLRDFQYISQSLETGKYSLGVRFFELGNLVTRRWPITEIARPMMKQLGEQVEATVHLGIEKDGEVLYIEKVDSKALVRIVSQVGGRLPMHCSALGKTLLAHMPESKVKGIIKRHGLKKFTENTISSYPVLAKELDIVKKRGYAIDDNEIMDGLTCIAFPIFDEYGKANYAISVSGLSRRLTGERMDNAILLLKEVADKIGECLVAS